MASKRYSSQLWLSRMWHGIRQYERIRKHEEEDGTSSEAGRKVRRLFKLSRRRPRTRRNRRIRFVLGIGRRLRWATVLSQLKVSWSRFAKLVKESQPHFADLLAGNLLLLHLTPPPPIYWYNHLEGVGGRNINGLPYGFFNSFHVEERRFAATNRSVGELCAEADWIVNPNGTTTVVMSGIH